MKSIKVELSPEQLEILKPLFIQVAKYNKENAHEIAGSIFAQIYKDGMLAIFLDNDTSVKVQAAIGSIPENKRNSMADSIAQRYEMSGAQ